MKKNVLNLRQKFLLIISISTILVVLIDLINGNFFLERFLEYGKQRELKKEFSFIDSKNGSINHKKLHLLQENSGSVSLVLDGKWIENEDEFPYLLITDENDHHFFLFISNILENNGVNDEASFKVGDRIFFTALNIINDYYVPYNISNFDKRFIDPKLSSFVESTPTLEAKSKNISGIIQKINFSREIVFRQDQKLNLSGQTALLDTLAINSDFLIKYRGENFIFNFGNQRVQILRKIINDKIVFISYAHGGTKEIQNAIAKYNTLKLLVVIIIIFISLFILDKIIISPITVATDKINRISKGEKVDRLTHESTDEIGMLFDSVNSLNNELEDLIALYKSQNENNRQLYKLLNEKTKLYMHEVRTPLSLISGYSKIAKDDLQSNSFTDLLESLDIISASAETLQNITDLDFNNENRELNLKLELQNFYLRDLLNLAVKIVKIESSNTKEITVEDSLDRETTVFADKVRMQQVIWNILNNSIHYAKHNILISTQDFGDRIRIFIQNDGPKIPDDEILLIWEPYFSKSEHGQGLGLHIVKRILTLHEMEFGVGNIEKNKMIVEFYFDLKKERAVL